MKTLTLLRHAKSGWDDAVPRDLDRPLNPKGRRAAQAMGREIKAMGLDFDRVLASPAVRVRETIEEAERGLGRALTPKWDRRLYLASAATLLDVVHEQDEATETLLLVGHNPGLEELVLALVPLSSDTVARRNVEEKFPTASVAVMTFPVEHWRDGREGGGTLVEFVRPRDLDLTLGPDAD